jgi:hypothetical protein
MVFSFSTRQRSDYGFASRLTNTSKGREAGGKREVEAGPSIRYKKIRH